MAVSRGDASGRSARRTWLGPTEALRPAYYAALAGLLPVALFLAPTDPLPTLGAAMGAWALCLPLGDRRDRAFGLIATLMVCLVARNYAGMDPGTRLAAGVAVASCTLPFVMLPLSRVRAFPFVHLFALVQGVYLATASLLSAPTALYVVRYPESVRRTGFVLTALFMVAFSIAAYLFDKLLEQRDVTPDPPPVTLGSGALRRGYVMAAGGLLGAWVMTEVLDLGTTLGSLDDFVKYLGIAGLSSVLLMTLDGTVRKRQYVAVFGLLGLLALIGLSSGLLYESAFPAFSVLGLVLAVRRQIPWLPLIFAVGVFVALNVAKPAIREVQAEERKRGTETLALSTLYLSETGSALGDSEVENLRAASYRFSTSDMVGYLSVHVPDRYPYRGAGTYLQLIEVIIPRAIYPDKPIYNLANVIGRDYELLESNDYTTSANTPLSAEAFIAGGMPAMLLVAVVSACVFGAAGRLLRRRTPEALVTGATMTVVVVSSVESGSMAILLMPILATGVFMIVRSVFRRFEEPLLTPVR